jgi:hypothetical protein
MLFLITQNFNKSVKRYTFSTPASSISSQMLYIISVQHVSSVYHATNAVTPDASGNYVLISIILFGSASDVPLITV